MSAIVKLSMFTSDIKKVSLYSSIFAVVCCIGTMDLSQHLLQGAQDGKEKKSIFEVRRGARVL